MTSPAVRAVAHCSRPRLPPGTQPETSSPPSWLIPPPLLHHDCHVHTPVIDAAEVITNCRKAAGGLGSDGDVLGLSWLDDFIKLQRTREKTMCHVLAVQTQGYGFALV